MKFRDYLIQSKEDETKEVYPKVYADSFWHSGYTFRNTARLMGVDTFAAKFGTVAGETLFGNKHVILIAIDKHKEDKAVLDYIKTNETADTKFMRYVTKTTMAGGMAPLIKINIPVRLAYFLDDESFETGEVDFVAKGTKLNAIRLSDAYLRGASFGSFVR